MVRIEAHNPATVVSGKGLFTQLMTVELGTATQFAFISGQVAWNASGEIVGRGDLRRQFAQVYENLSNLVESVGGGLESIVQLRTYLTNPALLPQFVAARNELYPALFPSGRYPTNTLLVVSALADPDILIEVEAVAVI